MILFLLILGTSFSASAQMIDLMGTLAVDGMMTAQSVKGYNTANHRVIFQTPVIISGIGAANYLYVNGKTNNGIDVQRFSYNKCEDIRVKYGIAEDKKIILGVSSVWNRKKGFDDFIKLSEVLPDDYVIVLVGLSPSQKVTLPRNIVGVVKTADQDELIKLYSEAYIFMNPSLEESFSLVTVEAMSCGLPAIVLDTSAV